jgi:hypothetical protein
MVRKRGTFQIYDRSSVPNLCDDAEPTVVSDAFMRPSGRMLLKWQPLMFSGLISNSYALAIGVREGYYFREVQISPQSISTQSSSSKSILLLFSHLPLAFQRQVDRQRGRRFFFCSVKRSAIKVAETTSSYYCDINVRFLVEFFYLMLYEVVSCVV